MGTKRKSLTLSEKLHLIEEIDNPGETRTDIAKRLQLPSSTLNGTYATREELQAAAEKSGSSSKTIKKVRQVSNKTLDGVLLEWFTQTETQTFR